jgi:hypothetical protein
MTSRCGAAKGASPGGVHLPTDNLAWLRERDGKSAPRGTDLCQSPGTGCRHTDGREVEPEPTREREHVGSPCGEQLFLDQTGHARYDGDERGRRAVQRDVVLQHLRDHRQHNKQV